MLKLKPRSLTVLLLVLFGGLLSLQHLIFSLSLGVDAATARGANYLLTDRLPLIGWLDRNDYDLHLRAQKKVERNPDVVVVEVNERSIKELGQFPFARRVYRDFLKQAAAAEAKVVAFDITFPEREGNEALREMTSAERAMESITGKTSPAVQALQARVNKLDGDQAFAEGLRETQIPVVLGFAFAGETVNIPESAKAALRRYDIFRRQIQDNSFLASSSGHSPVLPHEGLLASLNANSSLGFFTAAADSDSVIRRAGAVMGFEQMAVGSLAVQAVSAYLGVTPALNGEGGLHLEDKDQTGRLAVPLNPDGTALLRFYGPEHTFPYVEFTDVVNGRLPAGTLKGKIVFVGATAVGLHDLRASPYSSNYPGVEVHATFASDMLNHQFMEKDGRFFWLGYLFLLVMILGASFFVYRLQPLWALALTGGVVAAFQVLAQDAFFDRGLVVPTLLPSFAALTTLFVGIMYRYFTEEKEKRQVRAAFSRYVSVDVVGEILKDPSKLRLGGQKKELTVMFCDLMGFTKLSEHMDAGQLTLLLNEYFTRMTTIILRNHGTLDKYMGDAIMCFWGAPLDLPGHAAYACRTALEMMEELNAINRDWQAKYGLTIGCRIGLNSGEMAVGNMGSEQVFSYTVMGDNVNLGSRLEGVNNVYATGVIVSDSTRLAAGSAFRYRPLDAVKVKGKEDAVEIFELLSLNDAEAEPEWLHPFRLGLAAYRAGRWEEAEASFGTCLALRPEDGPTKVFLERVREFRTNAPADWNGVWKLHSK